MTDSQPAENTRENLDWTRHELVAWGVVGGVALAMRLAQLDVAPLAAGEAAEATAAWRAATGQGMPIHGYSPLLLVVNTLVFALFGASDALARFWPALFGAALAVTPILLRHRLGRVATLGSAVYLAISPTALIASRQLSGTTLAAAATITFVGALSRFQGTGKSGWLLLGAASLGAAVASAATVYGLLLPAALAWIFASQPGASADPSRAGRELTHLRRHAGQFALVFTLSTLAFSTGLGWNLPGMGAVGGLVADWFARFQPSEVRAVSLLTLLGVYEVLGVILGLAGLVWGVRRQQPWAALLGLWAGLAALLLGLMPGRVPTDLLWVVIPLAMLSGLAVEAIARTDLASAGGVRVVYALLALILWAQAYLLVARYAASGDRMDLTVAVAVGGLQVLLALSFGLVLGPDRTLATAATTTSVVLLALSVSAGWGVAYRRPDDPREALVNQPTTVNVRDLVATLRELSWQQTGMPTTLEFVYAAPSDSVLAWYLRDFDMTTRVDQLTELDAGDLGPTVVTVEGNEPEPGALIEAYVGQDFVVRRQPWIPRLIGCRLWESGCSVAFDWFLFREGPALPSADRWATLWRRVELADGD